MPKYRETDANAYCTFYQKSEHFNSVDRVEQTVVALEGSLNSSNPADYASI